MIYFTLPNVPVRIRSHPTTTGWILEEFVVDKENPTTITEEEYNDYGSDGGRTQIEKTEYATTYNIHHLKIDGTVELIFKYKKFPWEYQNLTEIKESDFFHAASSSSTTQAPYGPQFGFSSDDRFFASFCRIYKYDLTEKNNQKRNMNGFVREGDRLALVEKIKNRSDSGVIVFDRNTGISEVIEPYLEYKSFGNPSIAISHDGLTIIVCYGNVKDGTCLGAIFDNPLIS